MRRKCTRFGRQSLTIRPLAAFLPSLEGTTLLFLPTSAHLGCNTGQKVCAANSVCAVSLNVLSLTLFVLSRSMCSLPHSVYSLPSLCLTLTVLSLTWFILSLSLTVLSPSHSVCALRLLLEDQPRGDVLKFQNFCGLVLIALPRMTKSGMCRAPVNALEVLHAACGGLSGPGVATRYAY